MLALFGRFSVIGAILMVTACDKNNLTVEQDTSLKGWVSSGGELFDDGKNPWFVQNTKEVDYCIVIDTQSISASRERIERFIEEGFKYWRAQFRSFKGLVPFASGSGSSGGTTHTNEVEYPPIATQEFKLNDCGPGIPLVFQFGEGTLSIEQKEYIQNLGSHISLTVRTSYDRVHLRGTGFIFIGSDFGPHSIMKGEEYIDRPWSHGSILYQVILHELGHLFGLPHTKGGIMAANYPDQITRKSYADFFQNFDPIFSWQTFFMPQPHYRKCFLSDLDKVGKKWLGIADSFRCIHIQLRAENESIKQIEIGASDTPLSEITPIGTAQVHSPTPVKVGIELASTLVLPSEQKAIELSTQQNLSEIPVSFFLTMDLGSTYRGPEGKERELYYRLSPNSFELFGNQNDKFGTLLFHQRKCLSGNHFSICF